MPDSVAKVVEERKREAEKDQLAEPRAEHPLSKRERVFTVGCCQDPAGEQQRACRERHTGKPVDDR